MSITLYFHNEPRAKKKGSAGRSWPAGRSLDTPVLVRAFHKTTISKKTKSFGILCLFFLDSMDVWHYQSNYSKKFIDK